MEPRSVVTVARTFIGTPYLHQGRSPGNGLDCIGVPILVCRTLGLLPKTFDFLSYGRDGSGKLETIVAQYCNPLDSPRLGALLLFKAVPNQTVAQHAAICSDWDGGLGMIHAYQNIGSVREHELIRFWLDRLMGVYGLPNINYEEQ